VLGVPIGTGWNLLDVASSDPNLASAQWFITELNEPSQLGSGAVNMLATYQNGRFSLYVPGYSSSMVLSSSQGVFVLSGRRGTWRPQGVPWTSASPASISRGWNLIAAPYPRSGQMTDAIARGINAGEVGGSVQEIATFGPSGYQVYIPGSGMPFLVPATSGFWVESSGESAWTPS
jgi:hypothetical protein